MTISLVVERHVGRPVGRPIVRRARFGPRDISDLTLWLDAADSNNLILRGATQYIASWLDSSGNGNHFNQSTESIQPEYQLSQQNGLATVAFNDVNNGYLVSVNNFISTDTDTWFFVFQSDLDGADIAPTLFGDYGSDANKLLLFRSENSGSQDIFYARDTNGDFLQVTPTLISSYSLLIGNRKPGVISTDYNDSINSQSGAYISTILSVGTTFPGLGSQANAVFGDHRNPDTQMKGHVAEVLRYSRELDSAEKNALKTYFKAKWGL